jgi:hypothetical protein
MQLSEGGWLAHRLTRTACGGQACRIRWSARHRNHHDTCAGRPTGPASCCSGFEQVHRAAGHASGSAYSGVVPPRAPVAPRHGDGGAPCTQERRAAVSSAAERSFETMKGTPSAEHGPRETGCCCQLTRLSPLLALAMAVPILQDQRVAASSAAARGFLG